MWTLIILLLALWVILTVLGLAIKGLAWLALVGIVLILITSVIGYLRRGAGKRAP